MSLARSPRSLFAIAAVSLAIALAPVVSATAASPSPSPSPSSSSPAPRPSAQSGTASVVVDTSVDLSVEPGTELQTYTPATFRAIVTPADAQGIVTFYADGQIFGQADVVAGQAVVESNSRSAGSANLTATFQPSQGMGWTSSTSSVVPIKVVGVPTLVIANKKGEAVAQGSPIKVGEPIRLIVSNFPANTLVTFSVGNIKLNAALVTDKNGAGNTVVVLSKTLPSSVYVMSAQGGKYNASFIFYVYNPISQPAPVPSSGGKGQHQHLNSRRHQRWFIRWRRR